MGETVRASAILGNLARKRGADNNTIPALWERYQLGEGLCSGQLLKIAHMMSPERRWLVTDHNRFVAGTYWNEWSSFRHSPAGEGQPNYEDILEPMGVREEYSRFIAPQRGDLVFDWGSGPGQMFPYLQPAEIARYVGVDFLPSVGYAFSKSFGGSEYPGKKRFIQHDLSLGLPVDEMEKQMAEADPSGGVKHISAYAATYTTLPTLKESAKRGLDPIFERNAKLPELDILMITDGKFSPRVLLYRFLTETLMRQALEGRFVAVARACRALPKMMKFGRTFREVSPLYYPEEIAAALEGAGLNVANINTEIMWGQSCALKVTP